MFCQHFPYITFQKSVETKTTQHIYTFFPSQKRTWSNSYLIKQTNPIVHHAWCFFLGGCQRCCFSLFLFRCFTRKSRSFKRFISRPRRKMARNRKLISSGGTIRKGQMKFEPGCLLGGRFTYFWFWFLTWRNDPIWRIHMFQIGWGLKPQKLAASD